MLDNACTMIDRFGPGLIINVRASRCCSVCDVWLHSCAISIYGEHMVNTSRATASYGNGRLAQHNMFHLQRERKRDRPELSC